MRWPTLEEPVEAKDHDLCDIWFREQRRHWSSSSLYICFFCRAVCCNCEVSIYRESKWRTDRMTYHIIRWMFPPKARQSYLLLNQLGRVSMLHETYQTGGIWVEASMPNPEIVCHCCLLALRRLYPTSQSKYSNICDIERLTERLLYISARL